MSLLNRRGFLTSSSTALLLGSSLLHAAPKNEEVKVADRIRGLLLGGAVGDALGGPIEFQPRAGIQGLVDPPKIWQSGESLDPAARVAAAGRLRLRSYHDLRPVPESYGQWNHNALPGTITDDTRHKLILLHALHVAGRANRWPIGVKDLAQAHLDWPKTAAVQGRPGYGELAKDWLEEWQFAARWVLGQRDLAQALPPERMWQALPTCSGQMTLPPLAAIFAGRPQQAYQAAYSLGFFDNGLAKDLNSAVVAGLSQALITPVKAGENRAAFEVILKSMRETDPFRFGKIRWSERAVDRWLNLALKLAREAKGEPSRLFASLESEFAQSSKWEAQVVVVVTFACLELADYDPLAALQLSLEWGHDSDSYAQLLGAFIGALYGAEIFPSAWRKAVVDRLKADHGTDLLEESLFLSQLCERSKSHPVIATP